VASVNLKNGQVEALLKVGGTPVDLAMKPDGGEVFVSNYEAQTISVVGPYTDEVSDSFLAGDHPVRSLVSGDNSTLYVSNFASNDIAVFDAITRKLITTVQVGSNPDALALTPAETMLLVADSGSGDVAVLLLDKRVDKKVQAPPPRLFLMIPTGARPSQIAVKTASKAN
jgi:YVTN family beta-propeller protein